MLILSLSGQAHCYGHWIFLALVVGRNRVDTSLFVNLYLFFLLFLRCGSSNRFRMPGLRHLRLYRRRLCMRSPLSNVKRFRISGRDDNQITYRNRAL